MWDYLPLSMKFLGGARLNSSLSEPMKMNGDYIQASFTNEFEH